MLLQSRYHNYLLQPLCVYRTTFMRDCMSLALFIARPLAVWRDIPDIHDNEACRHRAPPRRCADSARHESAPERGCFDDRSAHEGVVFHPSAPEAAFEIEVLRALLRRARLGPGVQLRQRGPNDGRRRQGALKAHSCHRPWRAKHAGRVEARAPPKEASLQLPSALRKRKGRCDKVQRDAT